MNPLFALPLYKAGMGVDSVLFYRYSIAVIGLALLMKLKGESFRLKKKEILPLICMGLLFSVSSLTLFDSYHYMDAGIASTILFVYPLLVAIIMAVFFKERISLITICSILLAMAGIGLLYRGDGEHTLNLFGVFLVFLSSLSYAIYMVGINRSGLQKLPSAKLSFYALLFGLSIYVVRLDGCTSLQAVPEGWLWVNVLALSLLPTIVSLVTMTLSVHYIGSTPTAILGALEPVTALVFGVWVFGEVLTPRILVGIAMVLIAVVLIVCGKQISFKALWAKAMHKK
jgi:drug/metabolite transporter (DMT)-like permease